MLSHTDRGDDRIDGKNQVNQGNLENKAPKAPRYVREHLWILIVLESVVDFTGCLEDQEQTTGNEDDVTPGEGLVKDLKDRLSQTDQPGDRKQHQDAKDQSKQQSNTTNSLTVRSGQARYDHGNEDDIVDAEHNFHRSKCDEACPDRRIEEPVKHDVRYRKVPP